MGTHQSKAKVILIYLAVKQRGVGDWCSLSKSVLHYVTDYVFCFLLSLSRCFGAVRKPNLPGGEGVYLFFEFTIKGPYRTLGNLRETKWSADQEQ